MLIRELSGLISLNDNEIIILGGNALEHGNLYLISRMSDVTVYNTAIGTFKTIVKKWKVGDDFKLCFKCEGN